MATRQEIDAASRSLLRLPEQIELCGAVASALIESEEAWWAEGFFARSTDYQRARDQVQRELQGARSQIRRIRRDTLSPDLIRADNRTLRMLDCCQKCPQANDQNLKAKKPFACLIKENGGQDALAPTRFTLDEQGQIHERR